MGLEGFTVPTTNVELIGVICFLVANLVFGYWKHLKDKSERNESHERIAEAVETVRDQVQNSHKTNLRNDIDEIRDGLFALQGMVEVNHEQQVKFQRDAYEDIQTLVRVAVKNHPKDMK